MDGMTLALVPGLESEPRDAPAGEKDSSMMRTLFLVCTALAATSCQRSSNDNSDSPPSATSPSGTSTSNPSNPSTTSLANRPSAERAALNVPASAAEADNTGKNERDRSGATVTPGDQGGSEADRDVTQQIRKAVVADDQLSMTAKNVKIITNEGVVTLRGPVVNSQEKTRIAATAKGVHGVKRVDNQLEIETK